MYRIEPSTEQRSSRSVHRIYEHRKYSGKTGHADISLLKVDNRIFISFFLFLICSVNHSDVSCFRVHCSVLFMFIYDKRLVHALAAIEREGYGTVVVPPKNNNAAEGTKVLFPTEN